MQPLLARSALIGFGLCALSASACHSHEVSRSSPLAAVHEPVGPVARVIPAGAVIANDERQLAELLADASGPREIWLRSRTYAGDWVVARSLTLRGEKGATLRGSGHGTVLELNAPDIEIDNLIVTNSGGKHTQEDAAIKAKAPRIAIKHVAVSQSLFGISLGPCLGCKLENSSVNGAGKYSELPGDGIKLWEASDSVVRNCVLENSRDLVVWYSRRVRLEGNTVRNSRYGSHFMYAHDSVVQNSNITSNVVGIFVMYSSRLRAEGNVLAGARGPAGIGIGFKESDGVGVDNNWVVANTVGIYLDRTPRSSATPVRFARNVIALNETALRFHSSEDGVEFDGNDFHRNPSSAEIEGGGDALRINFHDNRWSDYAGYDLDANGIGDVRHEVKRLSSSLLEEHPSLRFFHGTAAMGFLEFVARVMPAFANEQLLTDPRPSVNSGGALP